MLFEDFIEQLFTSVKSPNGAITCFVYVDGEELLNTTCLFTDVMSDNIMCADRLSLAIDPVIEQAIREDKTVSMMAVVSVGNNDDVYRFKYVDGDLVCNRPIYEKLSSQNTTLVNNNLTKTVEDRAKVSEEVRLLMKRNGAIEDEARYNKRLSILKQIHCGKPIEHDQLHKLYNELTKTYF